LDSSLLKKIRKKRSPHETPAMHSFQYRKHELCCEDAHLQEVAKQVGTPVYVYSANTILDHYRRLDLALGMIEHSICYAVKANSNLAILSLLAKENAGF